MSIGTKIRELREERNMSLDDVAKLCKTTRQTIYKYENGIVTNIPYDRIILLSKALNTTPANLLGLESNKEISDQLVLTGVDKELYELLMQIPEEQKKLFLEMGRVFVNNLNKG